MIKNRKFLSYIRDIALGIALGLGLGAAILLWVPLAAQGQHLDTSVPTWTISVRVACRSQDAAVAVVEAGVKRERLFWSFVTTGICFVSSQPIIAAIHGVSTTAVWAGDSLDDVMVIVEIYLHPDALPIWTWAMEDSWEKVSDAPISREI